MLPKKILSLYHDLFSELASEDSALYSCVSSPPPVGIAARAVLRLTLAEADPDIALEPDVVARRELERIEARCEDPQVPLVLPLSKDGRVRSTPVIISHLQTCYNLLFFSFSDCILKLTRYSFSPSSPIVVATQRLAKPP